MTKGTPLFPDPRLTVYVRAATGGVGGGLADCERAAGVDFQDVG